MVMLVEKVAAPFRARLATSWIQGVEAGDQPADSPLLLMVGPAGAAEEVLDDDADDDDDDQEAEAEGDVGDPPVDQLLLTYS